VSVYADESCLGNGRAGRHAGRRRGVVEWTHPATGELLRWDWWIAEPDTTNNRMALRSVIETFAGLSARGAHRSRCCSRATASTSSDGMTAWVPGWRARGWTRKAGPIENLELWKEAVAAAERHEAAWRWVKGHAGHPQNEYANHLATARRADQTSSGGFVPSGFDAWLAAERAAGGWAGGSTRSPTRRGSGPAWPDPGLRPGAAAACDAGRRPRVPGHHRSGSVPPPRRLRVPPLLLLGLGLAAGYAYGFRDARTHDQTIIRRTADAVLARAGGSARGRYTPRRGRRGRARGRPPVAPRPAVRLGRAGAPPRGGATRPARRARPSPAPA
jgi:ribonuclease HI